MCTTGRTVHAQRRARPRGQLSGAHADGERGEQRAVNSHEHGRGFGRDWQRLKLVVDCREQIDCAGRVESERSGVLSGTPTAVGSYTVIVTVTDSASNTTSARFSTR
jgi:hypothetical protein